MALLRCIRSLMAQSGQIVASARLSAFGGKADIPDSANRGLLSALDIPAL